MTDYSEAGFEGGVQKVTCASGTTPIAYGLNAAIEDLKGTDGPIAVILVSDGEKREMDPNPVGAAESLKRNTAIEFVSIRF